MRRGNPKARAGVHDNHQAGLASKFRWRCPGDYFKRLDRICGNLIGKHFALLIGDWLPIYGKRIRGMVAQTVKQTVGVRCNARSRERNQRTHFEKKRFPTARFEKITIHVGMECRIGLDQVSAV